MLSQVRFGEECVADFDDAHLAWSGTFESHTSSAHGEYQDRLRAIHLRKQGWAKAEIAKDIGRSERFVARWWQFEPLAVPRPPGIHQYLAHSMISEKKVDRTDMWRGVEVVRGFFKDTLGLYDEIVSSFTSWKQGASETKDFRTASYFLRYDREGKMRMMTMKSAGYRSGVVSRLDALVSKIHQKIKVTDPNHGAGMYWFSDGDASVGSHRHVFWSARVALGAERIMMVDKTPILMQEGDLVIIGPQRHGVPSMPEISEGSLRISVPFKPQKQERTPQAKSSHKTGKARDRSQVEAAVTEKSGESEGESDAWYEEEHEQDQWNQWDQWDNGDNDDSMDLQTLTGMGFDERSSATALQVCGSLERAIDALTNEEFAEMLKGMTGEIDREDAEVDDVDDVDASLARKLQMQELQVDTTNSELQEQFEEYERLLEIDDAERAWDGYGDLMHNSTRRANLNLDMLGSQTLFSVGAAAQTEKQFFELLSLHSIRILYDFRPSDYRDEVRCQQAHFEVRILKSNCRQRHIHYRHVAVGRETAYGTLKHLQSDEVQHILVELVWQAKHGGRTAFLGLEEDWRADARVALAEELAKHGHTVHHVRADGSIEDHEVGIEMPDFLLQEESRLRKIHAQRQAGELQRVEKSVDRSTEAVARSLATEKMQIDVSAELRDAENQDALTRAQKRMVRLQVSASKKEAGLGKKELVAVPSHIAKEAAAVREKLEAKKADKMKGKNSSGASTEPRDHGSMAASSTDVPNHMSLQAEPSVDEVSGVGMLAQPSETNPPDMGYPSTGDLESTEQERRRRWGPREESSAAASTIPRRWARGTWRV